MSEIATADLQAYARMRDAEVMQLRRENRRLREANLELLSALAAMVDRWEPDTAGADRRMWEDACAAIAKARE